MQPQPSRFCAVLAIRPACTEPHSFRADNGQFLLDGKPFRIISGEMHYARIPREYWRDRLRMAKAMGLNTVTTYVFWNAHEPRPGVYDFSGNLDVAEFVREAQQEGLYVILRPGPYSCAEWEFGGFPAWLLKDPDHGRPLAATRSSSPPRAPGSSVSARKWRPSRSATAAPSSPSRSKTNTAPTATTTSTWKTSTTILVDAGFTKSQLYTADGAEELPRGSLPELPAVINFGPGEAQRSFATLKKLRPEGPFMNGEYWDGWFDHWGAPHAHTNAQQQASDLDWILRQGYSISIYMFHGGTSFGWMNGANSNGKNYEPDVTSYDYDAALDESGHPTPKYFLFRDVIARDTGITPPPVPSAPSPIAISAFTMDRVASLWDNLPPPVHSEQPLTMEAMDQSYGYVLYRTQIHGPISGNLAIGAVHDYAQVYIDGKLQGVIDRRLDQTSLPVHLDRPRARLDILLENTGRVNFGSALPGERVGLLNGVTLAGRPLTGWDNYSLPMLSSGTLQWRPPCQGPCFYHATFTIDHPADTFLDTSQLGKGMVWINGRPLGRFWNVGPQKALYLPAPFLKPGRNEVVLFDLNGEQGRTLQGLDHPVLDAPTAK